MRLLLLTGLVTGCASDLDRNIEPHVTIEQGIYGQLVSESDSGRSPTVMKDVPVDAYDRATLVHRAATQTDGNGVYQLSLGFGSYFVCVYQSTPTVLAPRGPCTAVDLGQGRLRVDATASIAGWGWDPT